MAPPLTIGWVHNLETAPEHSNVLKLVSIAIVFCSLSCLALLLRLYCRWHILKLKGPDDAATAFGFFVATAYCANNIVGTLCNLRNDVQSDGQRLIDI